MRVDGRCYRFTDGASGRSIVSAWDTAYHEPIATFAQGADLLVHEASFAADPQKYSAESLRASGHSTAMDAAHIAKKAQVSRLMLIHYKMADIESSLQAARAIFTETYAAGDGERLVL